MASLFFAPTSRLLLTCEHGGNRVPAAYRELFAGHDDTLASHRGYDIGAFDAARELSRRLKAPLIASTTTRLLVDLNRSPGHPRLWSEFTRPLPEAERERIKARHYQPYRDRVMHWLDAVLEHESPVLHLSVHSFTPRLNGRSRRCDVGLLYDPSRPLEVDFCREWQRRLRDSAPQLVVRRNYPYKGVSDGFVTWLRNRYGPRRYAGIELEISQSLAMEGGPAWRQLLAALAAGWPRAR